MLPDIAGRRGPKDRVHHRMTHRIRIRMSGETPVMGNYNTTKHQRPSLNQPVQVIADAYPPGRHSILKYPPRDYQITLGRDLDVPLVALNNRDPMPGSFRKNGLIGNTNSLFTQADRFSQYVPPERLRRLRLDHSLASQRSSHETTRPDRTLFKSIVHSYGGNGRSVPRRSRNGPTDQRGGTEWPGGIMHYDDVASRGRVEPVCHRVLTPVASRHDPDRRATWRGYQTQITR